MAHRCSFTVFESHRPFERDSGYFVQCYGLNCVPSKSICWRPNPEDHRMWLFGDRAFQAVIKLKRGHYVGA